MPHKCELRTRNIADAFKDLPAAADGEGPRMTQASASHIAEAGRRICQEAGDLEELAVATLLKRILGNTEVLDGMWAYHEIDRALKEATTRLQPILAMQLTGNFSIELRPHSSRDFTTLKDYRAVRGYEEAVRLARALPRDAGDYRIVAIVNNQDI